jgi:CheY-like chemotaxis protein
MARESLPEVILMDINLPGISGIEAMKILREGSATVSWFSLKWTFPVHV